MKRNKYISALLALLAFVAVGFFLFTQERRPLERTERMRQVSVIVSNSSDSRWTRFQAGLEKAADDYRISLNYVLTESFDSLDEEERVLRNESGDADAVIVQLVDSRGTIDLINELIGSRVLVLVDTDAEAEARDNFSSITADNIGIGTALADKIGTDTDLSEHRIGVIAGNQNMSSMQERLLAFEEELTRLGGRVQWKINDVSQLLDKQEDIRADIIVAMDNTMLEAVVDQTADDPDEIMIYGIGCSDKTIYYLDRGVIAAMVVPNDFQMGYLAVADSAARINEPNNPMNHREISYDVITRSNIYDSRNETLLFPVIN